MKRTPLGASLFTAILTALLGAACGSNTPTIAQPNTSIPYLTVSGPNVMPATIGGPTLCGQSGYVNELCTTVKVCMPGTSECQTVTDILVDTGSVGLRVFSAALPFSLPSLTDSGGNTVAECAQFGTGSDWGEMATADVVLGGEAPVTAVVQVINKSFAHPPSACAQADSDPGHAGYNGILGLGSFTQDCGQICATLPTNGMYFSCTSAGACAGAIAPLSSQAPNVVGLLPVDGNGLIVALPPLDPGGAAGASGVIVLGIGTATNNSPIGVKPYPIDSLGNFTTLFGGATYDNSFVDTGSNGLFFPNSPGLATCNSSGANPSSSTGPASATQFYCPGSIQTLTASTGSGGATAQITFQIANATNLFSSSNLAFNDLGGAGADGFDWGLPFFFGRAVFESFQGKTSTLGSGPLLAY